MTDSPYCPDGTPHHRVLDSANVGVCKLCGDARQYPRTPAMLTHYDARAINKGRRENTGDLFVATMQSGGRTDWR